MTTPCLPRRLVLAFAALSALLPVSCSMKRPIRHDADGRIIIVPNNGPLEGDVAREREEALMRQLFKEMYPGYSYEPSTWQYSPETFLARIAGNTCTDVIGITDATAGISLAQAGLAMDITDLLKGWEKFEYLNPIVLGTYQSNGRIYGLPAGPGYTMCLAYNMNMFRAAGIVDENGEPDPPDTWQELVEDAVKLTDRERGIWGFAILGKDEGASWQLLNWVYQAGGDFERRDAEGHWHAVYDEPEAVTALRFLHDLRFKYDVIPHDVFMDNDDQMELFAANRLAMCIFVPEYLDIMARVHSYPVANIGIAMLPAGPAGYAAVMGGGFGIINPRLTDPRIIQGSFDILTFSIEPRKWELLCRIRSEQGRPVGYPAVAIWTGAMQASWEAIEDRYRNVPEFPEYVSVVSQHARYEPPIHCKQLYTELYPVLQEVLSNPDVDIPALLHRSARRFESGHLY